MVERGRSGAYIPVGMIHRSQLEVTSPWSYLERAKRSHAEDVCPDCAAEQGLKKRESARSRDKAAQDAARFHGPAFAVARPCPIRAPSKVSQVTTETELPNNTSAIVVVQHEGVLDRLVTDPRKGPLSRDSTRRISDNLAKVSKAVAELGSVDEYAVAVKVDVVKPQAIEVDHPNVETKDDKQDSMGELLETLHAIAGEMSIDLSEGPQKDDNALMPQVKRDSISAQSLFLRNEAEDLLTEPTSPGPTSEAAMAAAIALRRHSHQSTNSSQSPASTYFTAATSRKHSFQSPIALPSSILRAADYSPFAAIPSAQQPASRPSTSNPTRTPVQLHPGHYPTSPTPLLPLSIAIKPELQRAPAPVKRVRVSDRWPPQEDVASLEGGNVGLRSDARRAVQEAAEMERGLRRRVRTHGGLSGAYARQK